MENGDEIRLEHIESDIKELKENYKENNREIIMLKENHIETKLYIKQIFESLTNLTATIKTLTDKPSKRWEQVIGTLITVVVSVGVTYFLTR